MARTLALICVLLPSAVSAQSLPAGWSQTSVGAPVQQGSATFSGDVFSVAGAGSGVSGRTDQFTFVHRFMSGDGTIVARLEGFVGSHPAARAGIMMRESLAAGSKYVFLDLLGTNAYLEFMRRTWQNKQSGWIAEVPGTAPVWLRLERRGSTVTAAQSIDGVVWTNVGSSYASNSNTIYVGLVVTNSGPEGLVTARFSGVDVRSSSGNQPPAVSLSSPAPGASYAAPATVAIAATASDPDGSVAQVSFYAGSLYLGSDTTAPYAYTWAGAAAGSHVLTAIARDKRGLQTVSAARTITVSPPAPPPAPSNQPPTVSLSAPASGATFTAPASVTVSALASDADGSVARVDFYAGSALIGSDATAPYSFVWSGVAVGSYSIAAVARDNVGASSAPSARSISVMANQPPTVSMTAPATGATFVAPATMTLSATASDPDGTIARVDFYSGSAMIGSDATAPYSMNWSNVAVGQYSFTAVARDNLGSMTVSGGRSAVVTDPQLPGHALFVPSTNHDTAVDRYMLEIFPNGANPAIGNPVATQDLGKPAIVNGECQADIAQTVTALAPGTYIATVIAIGSAGSSRSAASAPFTR